MRPEISILQLRCANPECRHLFHRYVVNRIPVAEYLQQLTGIRCLECESDQISMGQDRSGPEDDTFRWGTTLPERTILWQETGEQGLSAKTIWAFMMGTRENENSHPHDVSDLRRCALLLRRIPEWSPRMPEMASVPGWARLAPAWDALIQIYHDEVGVDLLHKPCPRTAEFLQTLID